MKITIIAEKSDQAEKYGKALNLSKEKGNWYGSYGGNDITVCALSGHVLSYKTPNEYDSNIKAFSDLSYLPFFPTNLGKKITKDKVYKNAKYQLDKADMIIIGTDIDEEGELIAYEVINMSKNNNKPIKRLWINDTTPKSIRKGMSELKDKSFSYGKYVQAATRSISDYLVGMNLTPYYTNQYKLKTKEDSLMSIGRVQVPTLWLIKNREDEINNWNYREYRKLSLVIRKNGQEITFTSPIKYYCDEVSDEEFDRLLDRFNSADLDSVAIDRINRELIEEPSPKLYNMPAIRSEANKQYKYEPTKTDEALQELHLGDNLTYPRTSVRYIPQERYDNLKEIYNKLAELVGYKDPMIEPVNLSRYVNDKEAREHTALVPTDNFPNFDELSEEAKKIFYLSLTRTLMMFAGQYKYNQTKYYIHVNGIDFVNSQNELLDLGWKKLDVSKPDTSKPVVDFEDHEVLYDFYVKAQIKKEQPPAHITETSLTKDNGEMSKYDLGTPATQTDIVNKIIQREYVKVVKEKGKAGYLTTTPKGELLCLLTKDTLLGNLDWTNKWQQSLKKVSQDTSYSKPFIDRIKSFIEKTVNEPLNINSEEADILVKAIIESNKVCQCPVCNKGMIIKQGKDRYKCNECDFIVYSTLASKRLTINQLKQVLVNGKTSNKIKFKSKNGKPFENYVIFDRNNKKLAFPDFKKEESKDKSTN